MNEHALYTVQVMHRRLFPVIYRFVYRVFYLLLDIDRLDSLGQMRWLSHNRFNLLSFRDRDHGPRDGSPLRSWLERLLQQQGIDLECGRVRLLCMPRVLGFGFNPISLWYCEHRDGSLRAVLVEVNNTFGGHHFYLLSREGAPMEYTASHQKKKIFHVSPLMDMGSDYAFRLSEPAETVSLGIQVFFPRETGLQAELMQVATLTGTRQPFTDRALLGQCLRMPLMTLKVVAAIHWQALKIWLRGARFFRDPGEPSHRVS